MGISVLPARTGIRWPARWLGWLDRFLIVFRGRWWTFWRRWQPPPCATQLACPLLEIGLTDGELERRLARQAKSFRVCRSCYFLWHRRAHLAARRGEALHAVRAARQAVRWLEFPIYAHGYLWQGARDPHLIGSCAEILARFEGPERGQAYLREHLPPADPGGHNHATLARLIARAQGRETSLNYLERVLQEHSDWSFCHVVAAELQREAGRFLHMKAHLHRAAQIPVPEALDLALAPLVGAVLLRVRNPRERPKYLPAESPNAAIQRVLEALRVLDEVEVGRRRRDNVPSLVQRTLRRVYDSIEEEPSEEVEPVVRPWWL